MTGLVLAWTHMPDIQPDVDRPTLQRWAEELHLPTPVFKHGLPSAFRRVSGDTEHTYEVGGQTWRLKVVEGKETPEFVTRELMRYDTADVVPPVKVAEVKFFAPRRNARGVIHGSHSLRIAVRKSLLPEHAAAAQEWFEMMCGQFDARQGMVPANQVRRQVRQALLDVGVPVLDKTSMYYLYEQEADIVDRIQTLLDRLGASGMIWSARLVVGDKERAQVAEAAEFAIEEMALETQMSVADIAGQRDVGAKARATQVLQRCQQLRARIGLHESRLELELPRARAHVDSIEKVLTANGFRLGKVRS